MTVERFPTTLEEVKRLTNAPQITKLYRWGNGDGITSFSSWDGESYERRFRHFCTVACAAKFGMAAANQEGTRP